LAAPLTKGHWLGFGKQFLNKGRKEVRKQVTEQGATTGILTGQIILTSSHISISKSDVRHFHGSLKINA